MLHNPMRASSYILLPKSIADKKAVVNNKNTDNYCFGWSVLSALFPAYNNINLTSSYPNFLEYLNFEGINFPVKLKDKKNMKNLKLFNQRLWIGKYIRRYQNEI